MKADPETSIIEDVRAWKEDLAAEHGFDIDRMIASAREREAQTGEQLLSPPPLAGIGRRQAMP